MKAKSEKALVLIVDDQEANRNILRDRMTALGHESQLAENGLSALALVEAGPPDLVLLDIMMPEMDGHDVLERLKAKSAWSHIPVIVISAATDMDGVVRCIEQGADDYLTKPFNPAILKARVGACLEKKFSRDREEELRLKIQDYNRRLEERVREQVGKIMAGHLGMIFAIAKMAESRDPETGEHLERMREYCRLLAVRLKSHPKHKETIDDAFVENIYTASPLHDIGKVGVPDRILQKPGKLTAEEFDIMKTHTSIGEETLREVDRKYPGNDFVRLGAQIAGSHQEKWDGSGYPLGLSGEDIPLVGRILALGDVYDALTSKRCYKEAFSHEKAKEIILEGRGKHFDPDVVQAFEESEAEFIAVQKQSRDSD